LKRGFDMAKSFPLSNVYGLLEPGPVVLVTTASKMKANIMTMSWYTMMEFEPPTVGCVISNRNYTFNILKATKECVINIPTLGLAEKVVGCGNSSGRKIDKFKDLGSRRRLPHTSKHRSSKSVMRTLNAGSSIRRWRPSITSSSLRCSRHGSTPHARTRRRCTIAGEALL
jgi:hypothetical protein